jgi:UDP-N-acetyl-D-mannosaminuronic acid dehydrogenase
VDKKSFYATDDYSRLSDRDIIIICVQTPVNQYNEPDYIDLKEAIHEMSWKMKSGALIIIESTLAPGTTENIIIPIIEQTGLKAGKDFLLAYSFERLMPGKLLQSIKELPRIVGGFDKESEYRAKKLYSSIIKAPIYTTNIKTAEATKTIENAYRDVNIAFANEMALICESLGINVYEVQELINTRSERMMHLPGTGVGGHCLPKDTWLLLYGLKLYGKKTVHTQFVELARSINNSMPHHIISLLYECLTIKEKRFTNIKVAILGAAYLENSDDIRNSPTYDLVHQLLSLGSEVIVHDPYVKEFHGVNLTNNIKTALKDSDALVVATKHKEYLAIDLEDIKGLMNTFIIVDGRNVFDSVKVTELGFLYKAIGKGGL